MEEIKIFENSQFGKIRTAGTSEEPLFCLADVCKAIGLTTNGITRRLQDDVISNHPITDNLGRTQQALFINEDGLYDVILDSRKPEAKAFRKWVTGEVLPSIRKHGAYATAATIESIIENPENGIKLLQELIKEREAKELAMQEAKQNEQRALTAEKEIVNLNHEIQMMQPKVSYYDLILNSKATMVVTQIAQDYGMSAKRFNILLRNLGIQRKVNGQWILYAPYIAQGYVQSKSIDIVRANGTHDNVQHSCWTQKGRLFLYETLKAHDILPMIER